MKRVFVWSVVFSFCFASYLSANWIVESEVVDSGSAGVYNAIALDATGSVHIAYYDAASCDLKHAVQVNALWVTDASDIAGDVGSHCSLAVDSSGVPHVSYRYSYQQTIPFVGTVERGDLKYASNAGSSWSLATVDSNPGRMGYYTSIAVDNSGQPRVAYHDAAQNKLRYVAKNGSGWGSPVTVEDGGRGASLVLDSSGNPHIAHVNGTELRYVFWNSSISQWIGTVVEDYQVANERTSIALDSSGYPHIVYVNPDGLRYAYWDGVAWTDELVYWISSTWSVGVSSPSLTLNRNDEPFISFHGNMWGDLAVVVAVRNGVDDWSIPVWLLEGTTPGGQSSITVGTNDILHVSFHDAGTGDLGYARVMEDSDDDWLPDWWEMKYFQDLNEVSTGDPDGDNWDNAYEYELGTDPSVSNSDGGSWDRDGDGLGNDDETNTHGTDPDDPDSDDDGLLDGAEVGFHLFWDSFEEAAIDDRWSNGGHQPWGIDAAVAQNENQSARSGAIAHDQSSYLELEAVLPGAGTISFWHGTSCASGSDYLRFSTNGIMHASYSGSNDWDLTYLEGISAGTNTFRWTYEKDSSGSVGDDAVWLDAVYVGVVGTGTSPTNSDCDADGLLDGAEVNTYGTDPLVADEDSDGLNDSQELAHGTNPKIADSDGDGLTDGDEVNTYGTLPLDDDTDNDGLLDGAEVNTHETDPTRADQDSDGLNDSQELANGTNPEVADSDGDGLTDGAEVNTYGTLPLDSDTDDDGLSDGAEVNTYGTLPLDDDTDNDGLLDGAEVNTHGTDPTRADQDNDGLNDSQELANGTNPEVADSDGDGLSDGDEVNTYGTLPLDSDTDDDGLSDGAEVNTYSTLPLDDDTDNDGLLDGAEVNTHGTDPAKADEDSDGLNDSQELANGTNPKVADSDGDGLTDGAEVNTHGTLPLDSDTDNDGLTDGAEVNIHGTLPLDGDTDNDGLLDGAEVNTYRTSPTNPDVDGDGLSDGDEVAANTDFNNPDSDGDTLSDGDEVHVWHCSPLLRDTDSDGMDDNTETVGYTAFADSFESGSFTNPPWADVGAIPWVIVAADAAGGTNSALLSLPAPSTSGELRLTSAIQAPGRLIYAVKCDAEQYEEFEVTDLQHSQLLDSFIDVSSWTLFTNDIPRGTVSISWKYTRFGSGVPGWVRLDQVLLFVPATGTDPAKADTDADGVADLQELDDGTNPTNPDSDSDGLDDGAEKSAGTNPNESDSDSDGLTDGAEVHTHGTLPLDNDTDNDGLLDGAEVNTHGSSPLLSDSDQDTLPDGDEVNTYGTRPDLADTDDDGLDDNEEINTYGTLPLDSDTDNDGLSDGDEVNLHHSDPKLTDTDFDGINDQAEVYDWGTRPDLADTDADGLLDGEEALARTFKDSFENNNIGHWWSRSGSPAWTIFNLPSSPDGTNSVYSGITLQGETNSIVLTLNARAGDLEYYVRRSLGDPVNTLDVYVDEQSVSGLSGDYDWTLLTIPLTAGPHSIRWTLTCGNTGNPWVLLDNISAPVAGTGSSPTNSDSDADALLDGDEIYLYGTNPQVADTDADGLDDGIEIITYGSDPLNADSDSDGLTDGAEVNTYGTSPLLVDTDGDLLSDGDEVLIHATDPNNIDSDADYLSDGEEVVTYGTLPLDSDTDDDGLLDGREVLSEIVTESESFEPAAPLTMSTPGVLDAGSSWPEGWTSGGDVPWVVASNVVYDGSGAVQSGAITAGQTSIIQWLAELPKGELSAFVKISCENPGDKLEFLVDGNLHQSYSGETNWFSCASGNLDAGWHTFSWRYTKDGSGDAGSDSAWLDLIEFTVAGTGTSPLEGDSDGDNMWDGWEVENEFDPLLPDDGGQDPDSDGLVNSNEFAIGTSPHDRDSDDDTMPDGWEVDNNLLPKADDGDEDPDSDGLINCDEFLNGSNPHDSDSDDDGLSDGDEVLIYHSSPSSTDTDGDGLKDNDEVLLHGTLPDKADSDGDGLDDKYEVTSGRSELVPSGIVLSGLAPRDGCLEWGDCDGDGDPDLVLGGRDINGVTVGSVHAYDGAGRFQHVDALGWPFFGDIALGDFDNDGDLDAASAGVVAWPGTLYSARIERNTGGEYNALFQTHQDLAGVYNASLSWGDLNNDGYLDLAVSGNRQTLPDGTFIYLYLPGSDSFADSGLRLPLGVVAWGDYNRDGWDDLAVGGKIYRNNAGSLTDIGVSLLNVTYGGGIEWGDYDGDGDLDIAMSRGSTRIYRNGGGDSFTSISDTLPDSDDDLAWGDVDNDGDLDLAIMGSSGNVPMRILINTTGVFANAGMNLPSVTEGGLGWADYDGDGDLDLAYCGETFVPAYDAVMGIYENVYVPRAEPLNPDTDNDGVTDGEEVLIFHTNPSLVDSDGDGLSDGWEIYGETLLNESFETPVLTPARPAVLSAALAGSWSCSGDAAWVMDTTASYDGSTSMRSGAVSDGQQSTLTYTAATGEGTLSFWYRVSSEPDADVLEFAVDGVPVTNWSGSVSWMHASVYVSSNAHTFSWTYRKNGSASSGDDSAGLDLVEFYDNGPGTDPADPDSDGDNMWDGWEVEMGFDPMQADGDDDADGDLLLNAAEYANHTDPHVADTDGDGQNDYEEVVITGMSPTNSASLLKIDLLNSTPSGTILRWPSASGREYDILQSTNLQHGFLQIKSGIPAGPDGYTRSTNAVHSGSVFYRIRALNPQINSD